METNPSGSTNPPISHKAALSRKLFVILLAAVPISVMAAFAIFWGRWEDFMIGQA